MKLFKLRKKKLAQAELIGIESVVKDYIKKSYNEAGKSRFSDEQNNIVN